MSPCASLISADRHSISAVKSHVFASRPTGSASRPGSAGRPVFAGRPYGSVDRTPVPADIHDGLKIFDCLKSGIFTSSSYDEELSGPDANNLESSLDVSSTITKRIHNIHPTSQVLGDINSPVQTRRRVKHKGSSEKEPTTVAQALADPEWVEAMQAGMQQLRNQKVWVLVTLPDGKRAIGTKWILKNKRDARVARIEAIRLFLAFASFMKFKVYQMDVKSAFLYGKIAEEVYVTQPRGFEDPDHKVYKDVKALYGLHQAPRAWYERLSTFLLKHDYRRGTIDKTLFIKKDSKDIMLVQVYVDDIIFGSTRKDWCEEFKTLMQSEFEMSSMGPLTFFLGLQVDQRPDGIFIHQEKYIADILKKFDLDNSKLASTPFEHQKIKEKNVPDEPVSVHLYRFMIGCLMYLTATRPDIMFAVCAAARHQVTPKTSNLLSVKWIFKYLTAYRKLGLWYPRDSSFDLEAFSDNDYAGANGDRISTTGGCQFLGRRLISWQCKKQTIVATSSCEAEYVAAASCCGQRTKHIEIRHHFIKDANEKKLIQVLKIPTEHNVADLLTKSFDVTRFGYLVVNIGMLNMFLLVGMVSAGGHSFLWFLFTSTGRVTFCWLFPIPASDLVSAYHMLFLLVMYFSCWYALTANPIIYASVVRQFWGSASEASLPDGVKGLMATIDGTAYTVTEATIRSALQLDDLNAIDTMTNEEFFAGLRNIRQSSPLPMPFGPAPTSRVVSTDSILDILSSSGPSEPVLETITSPFRDDDTGGASFHESPPRPHSATLTFCPTVGVAEEPLTLTSLLALFSTCLQRIATLEAELKATKILHRDTVILFSKRIKKLESKLKSKKRKLVLSDSENEEEEMQSKELDALLDLANAALHEPSLSTTSSKPANPEQSSEKEFSLTTLDAQSSSGLDFTDADIPAGGLTSAGISVAAGLTVLAEPSSPLRDPSKGKAVATSSSPITSLTAKELADQQAVILEAERQELLEQELKQSIDAEQVYLDSLVVLNLTNEEWIGLVDQVWANQTLSAELLGADVSEDTFSVRMVELMNRRRKAIAEMKAKAKREKPMTPAQQKEFMRTFVKNQSSIRRAVDLATDKAQHQQLKRSCETLESLESKKLKSSHSITLPSEMQETTSVSAGTTIAAGDPIPTVTSVSAASSISAGVPIVADVSISADASGTASQASVLIIELLDSPSKDTFLPLDPETEEQDAPLRKSSRKKSIARKRTLPSPSKPKSDALPFDEDDPEAEFKRYLRQASDNDEPAEPVSLALVFDITTWEIIPTEFGRDEIHVITRADGTVKWFSTLRELMYWAGRTDLIVLYGLVLDKYKTERATCIGLGLWMDLRTLITAREERDASIIWDDQDQWQIQSWRFYVIPAIHMLETEAGDIMYMFVDKKALTMPAWVLNCLDFKLEEIVMAMMTCLKSSGVHYQCFTVKCGLLWWFQIDYLPFSTLLVPHKFNKANQRGFKDDYGASSSTFTIIMLLLILLAHCSYDDLLLETRQ
uniref:Reverse transcriptase Ty1/copia-type domain-containing protein n=1 Tax=Tanacetum cinerariifolium TaxID=118510 RepID=A0A6L2NK95_TANCI|nr:hypothetical protein [Tanacetum cinerariifolium]